MSSKKTIVILGATGTQGGSVVNTFLPLSSAYSIRAISRSTSSSKAQALAAKGVDVVQADVSDISSVVAAFKGANYIFSVTDFWGLAMNPASQAQAQAEGKDVMKWSYDTELSQGKNIFDAAAKTEGLERLIYSGLADVSKWSRGKYTHSLHFDTKAHAIEYARKTHPELWLKTSIIQMGWYLENWRDVPFMHPKKDETGVYDFVVNVPADLKLPLIATYDDCGPLVKALIDEPHAGKNLIAYREYTSVQEMVRAWAEVLGVQATVTFVRINIANADFFLKQVGEGYAFWEEFGYEARDDPTVIHPGQLTAKPHLGSIRDWVAKQDWSNVLKQ